MFIEHFKLGVQPFGVTPDARFLYLSQTHREAIASLLYGIHSGRGFTALIADPGMGKTTLLFHVLGLLMENAKTAFLFQTLCGPEEFLRSLLADLGIKGESGDIAGMHAKLNAYLLKESKSGRQVVVIIDEAQNLDDRVLELVRMLSNFETPGKKLMHLILSGQPQLAAKIASPSLTQLRQRISIVARLAPFSSAETREYIEHRLRVAGSVPDKPLFSNQAFAMIAEQSCGIPRNINNLCFNSMSLACALKQHQVGALMVQETINDLDLTTIAAPPKPEFKRYRPWVFDTLAALFASWRYGASLAMGFLICFALFVYLRAPSKDHLLPKDSANAFPQKTTRTSEEVPAANVLPSEGAKGRISQPEGNVLTHTPAITPLHNEETKSTVPLAEHAGHKNADRASASSTILETHGDSGPAESDILELGPVPKDLQLLQFGRLPELNLNHQVLDKTQAIPEQSPIPFDLAPQREKP